MEENPYKKEENSPIHLKPKRLSLDKHETCEDITGKTVVHRIARILNALKDHEEMGINISALAREVDLPRTTVQRLVHSLAAEGFVKYLTAEKAIYLGPAIHKLAQAAMHNVVRFVYPYMEEIYRQFKETTSLWSLRENRAFLIKGIQSEQELSVVFRHNVYYPFHCCAHGKIFLSEMSATELERILNEPLADYTAHTITHAQALREEIVYIRKTGIALDLQEHSEDICAIALRISLPNLDPYVLSMACPAKRFYAAQNEIEQAFRKIKSKMDHAIMSCSA